jgi:hypothetical protein
MQERSERTYEGIKWRRLGARNLLRGKFKWEIWLNCIRLHWISAINLSNELRF